VLKGDRVGIFTGNRLEAVTRGISIEDLAAVASGSLG
jgi:hypothetical protein